MKKKKRIISYDTKVKAVERVHDGESKSSVSRDLKVSVTAVCDWVLTVERKGFEALYSSGNYKTYSNQFRINMVKSFLKSSLSMNEFTRENSLGSHSNLQRWLSKYKDGTLLEKLNREKLMNNNSRKKARNLIQKKN
jgi:CENP-B N-terminal DNA-binding domain.